MGKPRHPLQDEKGRFTAPVKPWKPGQSGNPNGRPKNLVTTVIKELEDQGATPTNATSIRALFLTLIGMRISDLQTLVQDDRQPAIVRITAGKILDKDGFYHILRILDRALGKPTQPIEQTGSLTVTNIPLTDLIKFHGPQTVDVDHEE